MAATNRPDILDRALIRPGRFDRQVRVGYPDIKGREAILHVHARKKPMESTVDFKRIAQSTIGFTGADLENLLNEAALLAALNSGKVRGAGLDVFAEEPTANAELYSHPNVSCTPHIGAATVEAQKRIGAEIVEIIRNF